MIATIEQVRLYDSAAVPAYIYGCRSDSEVTL